MFCGFDTRSLTTERGEIHARVGGSGPPLLLLHGYPETHLMWHAAAPLLAERFTVVATDLSGYGDSLRPVPAADRRASHFLVEDRPEEVSSELAAFFEAR
jgi:haloacetate dehalogenase